ncbi:AraC family transcriptional regulator [Polymorphobacter arshaanensis]|uniref:AraC family transcriptional regulator n=1 Tax=Glacieibacterium arshaanense TaxID=2511025 RepID=A0A4Y9ELM6_9SPHN|nr:AraC family transcriptional regulator [Polymorphobacter arshaanensis]TFU02976.1 AraC family transcriptional regulator [Polymorphobacter arshaanensis]
MSDSPQTQSQSLDALQRVGPLVHLPALAAEYGVALDAIVNGTGVAAAAFADSDALISYRQCSRILARCAKLTGNPQFGLLLGARTTTADLGQLGALFRAAPTLGQAMVAAVDVQAVNSRGATVYLHRSGDDVVFGYAIYERDAVAQDQLYPMLVAALASVIRELTQGAVVPVEMLLPLRPPVDQRPFDVALGAPLRFDQAEAGVVLPVAALDAPVAGGDPETFNRISSNASAQLAQAQRPWTRRVQRAMRPLILRGAPSTGAMARLLGIELRTLTRHLAREGTTFQTELDATRRAMACELLQTTGLAIADVADALAYAHQASFTDAFRRWTGKTPSDWRAAAA